MKHESIETNAGLLIVLTLIVISIGGLVEIVPLYFMVLDSKPVVPFSALAYVFFSLFLGQI